MNYVLTPEGTNFSVGDVIIFEFDIKSPAFDVGSSPIELVKVAYFTEHISDFYSNIESWSPYEPNSKTNVYFELGPNFAVPEIPLGTLTILVTTILTYSLLKKLYH